MKREISILLLHYCSAVICARCGTISVEQRESQNYFKNKINKQRWQRTTVPATATSEIKGLFNSILNDNNALFFILFFGERVSQSVSCYLTREAIYNNTPLTSSDVNRKICSSHGNQSHPLHDRSVFPHLPWMAVFENENFEEKENIRVFPRVARYDGWLDSDRL